MSYRQQIVGGY